jgi:hypothetical protein
MCLGKKALPKVAFFTIYRHILFTMSDPPKQSLEETYKHDLVLKELFGILPLNFVDKMVNIINHRFYESSTIFETLVKSLQPGEHSTALEFSRFETAMEHLIEQQVSILEDYTLNSIFALPRELPILLPQHQDVDYDVTLDDELQLDQELKAVRHQLLQASGFYAALTTIYNILRFRHA